MSSKGGNLIQACAKELALTTSELLTIAATAPQRYHVWHIKKKSGPDLRTLCHPARELKPVQRYLAKNVLNSLPIHEAATAYVKGGSIANNASVHIKSRVILKIDFQNFFHRLQVKDWQRFVADHLSHWSDEETSFSTSILFWGMRTETPMCLAIGAPSSPMLSNILCFEIDQSLHSYATDYNMRYTRYADDITFSSNSYINKEATLEFVANTLREAKYSSLRINDAKTILVSKAGSRRITGLIITPERKISLGRKRKRDISAMIHHVKYNNIDSIRISELSGLLAFCNDVEPEFVVALRRKYSSELIDALMRKRGSQLRVEFPS